MLFLRGDHTIPDEALSSVSSRTISGIVGRFSGSQDAQGLGRLAPFFVVLSDDRGL